MNTASMSLQELIEAYRMYARLTSLTRNERREKETLYRALQRRYRAQEMR